MPAHPLAPYVLVTYYRNSRVGLIKQRTALDSDAADKAEFAIVTVHALDAGEPSREVRFDLPFDRPQLDAFVAAVTIAYGLGHRDRANRMRKLLGLAPTRFILDLDRLPDDVD